MASRIEQIDQITYSKYGFHTHDWDKGRSAGSVGGKSIPARIIKEEVCNLSGNNEEVARKLNEFFTTVPKDLKGFDKDLWKGGNGNKIKHWEDGHYYTGVCINIIGGGLKENETSRIVYVIGGLSHLADKSSLV